MTKNPNPVTHNSDGSSTIHILYKGEPFECVIDTADYSKISDYRWNVKPDIKKSGRTNWYVYRGREHLPMHTVLMGAKGVDHINHNGLDNRQSNLRLSTARENACNRRKRIGNYTSSYKGVYAVGKSWAAKVDNDYLGCYSTELEAAQVYNAAATAKHGEFAVLNQTGG